MLSAEQMNNAGEQSWAKNVTNQLPLYLKSGSGEVYIPVPAYGFT